MPVRSGPICVALAGVDVALGAVLLEDLLARGRRRRSSSSSGSSSSITFCRSGSGRPPPRARSFLARAAICRSGWAARACFWSSVRSVSCDLALVERVEQGAWSSRAGQQHAQAAAARRRRSAAAAARRASGRPSAASLRPSASSRPAASSGRRARRDQLQQLLAAICVVAGRNSISCCAASMRSASGSLSSCDLRPGAPSAISAAYFSKLLLPQRGASSTSCRCAAGGELGRAARPAPSRLSSSSVGRLALRPALGQAGDDRLGDRRSALGQRGQQRGRRESAGPPRA